MQAVWQRPKENAGYVESKVAVVHSRCEEQNAGYRSLGEKDGNWITRTRAPRSSPLSGDEAKSEPEELATAGMVDEDPMRASRKVCDEENAVLP